MKSIVILTTAKHDSFLKELLINKNILNCNCFEAHNFQGIYKISLKNELDVVIINQGIDSIEEHYVVTYLNQKNASTILIPYQQNIRNQIKKRLHKILKDKITSL